MSNFFPEELYYSQNHEWLQVDENLVTVGLTEYAIEKLGEILYVELPDEGQHANLGTAFCSLESILRIHDIICPVNGTVLEINSSLIDDPTPLNDDPYGEGWLLRIEMDNERELAHFLRSKEYRNLVDGLQKSNP